LQPFQLFSCSGSGNAAMAEAGVQLWQLSSSSSLVVTAQQHQQHSQVQQYQLRQPCSPNQQPCSRAALQPCSRAAPINTLAAVQPCSHAALQPCSLAAMQPCSTKLQACMTLSITLN